MNISLLPHATHKVKSTVGQHLPLTFGQILRPDPSDAFHRQEHSRTQTKALGKMAATLLPLPIGQAETTAEFVQQMRQLIQNSPWVELDQKRLTEVARSFDKAPGLLDWKGYISDKAFDASPPDLNRAMFELGMNIANQSGFITGRPGRKAEKWEIGGSGARAMVQTIANIRDAGLLPGIDLKDAAHISKKLGPLLKDVPFSRDRMAIFREFAQPGAYEAVGNILEQSRTGPNSYRFNFQTMKALAKAFPKSFGTDPFYKKASLVLIAMAGFGRPRGMDVQLDLPVAADYRLPQTLERLGILRFSPELVQALKLGKSFHEDHAVVQHLRAASVVASADLARQTGFDSAAIDGLLWSAARKQAKADPTSGASELPHLMVPTMRF